MEQPKSLRAARRELAERMEERRAFANKESNAGRYALAQGYAADARKLQDAIAILDAIDIGDPPVVDELSDG